MKITICPTWETTWVYSTSLSFFYVYKPLSRFPFAIMEVFAKLFAIDSIFRLRFAS